ncbi:GNAT family N-acetyltransferase [Metabacillus bambusae]|uniref:GNAT family N-acetyltransferase n=1 Tax=Metabacillus bambusae TaxID=2795218 RepID=A0ABS3N604_9BACI|nr:GNAT family N-acetyltransferase [Metabacillus bambusae]MBO1513722.1 GNAT family N-acetyltransferase [Metabacillus bambusae]
MEIQAEVLFQYDKSGRMQQINEPLKMNAPLFFLGRTKDGNVTKFHSALSDTKISEIKKVIAEDSLNVNLSKLINMLKSSTQSIKNLWIGPAYVFSDNINRPSVALKITYENKHLLLKEFPTIFEQLEWRQPCFGIIEDGFVVSICCSARRSLSAAEASVETIEEYRGRGYGVQTAIAWAKALQEEGIIPLYSTSWDNFSSQAVAKKLKLYSYGIDFHIS